MPSSVKLGVRPRIFLIRSNSSGVRPCSATSSGVTTGSADICDELSGWEEGCHSDCGLRKPDCGELAQAAVQYSVTCTLATHIVLGAFAFRFPQSATESGFFAR